MALCLHGLATVQGHIILILNGSPYGQLPQPPYATHYAYLSILTPISIFKGVLHVSQCSICLGYVGTVLHTYSFLGVATEYAHIHLVTDLHYYFAFPFVCFNSVGYSIVKERVAV